MSLLPRLLLACVIAISCMASASAATINAASCSQANVATAISSAAVGDTVQVPAGACTWSSLSIAKAIWLKGAGVGQTTITLGANGLGVTKQTTGVTRVSNFSFTKTGGTNESHGITLGGSWQGAEPIIFQNNDYTISGSGLFQIDVAGGIIIANSSFTSDVDDSLIRPKNYGDDLSWQTADTIGNHDTTGKRNIYIETNTFYGGANQAVDCDDGSRCVYRYNNSTYSSFNSHGQATSPVGVRHWEVYGNNFIHLGGTTDIANQNWAVWIRGATGVIFNNHFDDIAGSWWGDKPEMQFSIRGIQDARPQGACGNLSYPVPRQLGQNYNGSSYFTDPLYIWGNTGAQAINAELNPSWGNPCNISFNTFFQWGRDGVKDGTAKPGYVPYTYPHPLLATTPPPADTTPPTVSLTAPTAGTTVSGSVTVSANASDDTGVAGVQFKLDGANMGPEDMVAPYSAAWDTTTAGNGSHSLTAVARDAAGNTTTSSSISVTVNNVTSAPAPLPEGNTGIAASYPNDINIRTDARVLFSDDFESYTSASQLTTNWNNYYQTANTRIATEPGNYYLGTKALEFTQPTGGEVANEIVKNLSSAQDTLFVRVYTKFSPGFNVTAPGHNGIRIETTTYPGPGNIPNGSDFFLFSMENSSYYGELQPGYLNTYAYHPEQRDNYGDHWYPDGKVIPFDATPGNFGPYFVPRANMIPQTDRWYAYEFMVKTNTPGARDGRVAMWVDGVLAADFQNLRIRDVNTLKIGRILLGLHAQGNTSGVDKKWFDNLVVATSYIGPVSQVTPPPVDTTPPTVAMTAPAEGVTVSGSVAVSATASDDVGVAGVQFKLDGANIQAEDVTTPYTITWDTKTAVNGQHSLTATARDAAGNATTSTVRTVTVSNAPAPPCTTSMLEQPNDILLGLRLIKPANAAADDDPCIITPPADKTVYVGQKATFQVMAVGTMPMAYQWYRNGSPIAGATGPAYTTPPATSQDNGAKFHVVVTNSVGSETTADATLTVKQPETLLNNATPQGTDTDNKAYELGMIFTPTADGDVVGFRYYATAAESGTHKARLWRNSDSTLVSGPTTIGKSGTGWQELILPAPVHVQAGVAYTISVSTGGDAKKYYAYRNSAFTSAGSNGQHMTWPANAGVFTATLGSRPTQVWNASNYYRDVLFVPSCN